VLGTFGGKNSYAMAINAGGQAAGTAQLSSGYTHAFLWSAGILQDLGTLGGGSSYAYGLNSAGDVVGYSWLRGGAAPHAFLFQDGVMLDLNGLIDPGSSWVLTQAFAINGNGQIAGAGLLDGVEHAFRLDYEPGFSDTASVPEPATWIVVFTGLLGARMKSWRKITTGK
jgi:probable HAF family extracellular repeat protein